MDPRILNDEAISQIKKLVAGGTAMKTTFDIASGLYGISLEAPATSLVPFLPSWANKIPREVIPSGNTHTYRRIKTLAQTGKSTAAEGTVGGGVTLTTDSPSVTFGIISSGLFSVTFEEERASKGFDDALAKATAFALLRGKRCECAHTLGGTISALGGVGATITAADNTSVTGDLANAAHYVNVKPLNGPALQAAILAGACVLPDATAHNSFAGIDAVVDLTNGWGLEGTEANATPTLNKGLLINWTAKKGAVAYGVFVGTTTGSANLKLQGVVGGCHVTLTHLATGGTACVATDTSADANGYDGLITLITATASGAYVKDLDGELSDASGNGIPEIDTMLSTCYTQSLGVDSGTLIMGTQDRAQVTRKLGQGTAYSLYRYQLNTDGSNRTLGGAFADRYVHPITGRVIPVETDPYLHSGTIIWLPDTIPYPMGNIPAPAKMWLSYDWANFAYAITAPVRNYENRMRGGLALYVPAACGIIYNIWNG